MAIITSPERIDMKTIPWIGLVAVLAMIIAVMLIHYRGLKPIQDETPKRKGQAWSIILVIVIFIILLFLLITYGAVSRP